MISETSIVNTPCGIVFVDWNLTRGVDVFHSTIKGRSQALRSRKDYAGAVAIDARFPKFFKEVASMGYYPHPVEIEYKSDDDVLCMTFSDDHVSEFPTTYLRGYCPCARCQGHSGGAPQWQEIQDHRQIEVVNVQQVGNYALTIIWGDGHDTGIYSFKSLREMCPCSECMPEGLSEKERCFY